MGCCFVRCVCLVVALDAGLTGAADERLPQWIWGDEIAGGKPGESVRPRTCVLSRTFELDGQVQDTTLRVAADFCHVRLTINGKGVLDLAAYSPTAVVDAKDFLRPGTNQIRVTGKGVGGPAAIAITLNVTTADGKQQAIHSDGQWTVAAEGGGGRPVVTRGSVPAGLWGAGRRAATIDPFDNYEQWRQAVGAESDAVVQGKFWTAPGFEISLVRSARAEEGSWVSMAFDPQGRLTIAREDKGLLRMTLAEDRAEVERVETIEDELAECRGLAYAHGALYAAANNSKGFYRLRDTDGDERFDEVVRLREFPGNVGHGRNDITLGADGAIYAICGDAVDVPKNELIDFTSPFRDARRGKNTREGFLMRYEPAADAWQLVAAGLRNPFGVAMNRYGDLFTYDADAEFDMGTPWYRPTRVVQLLWGGDFGWRGVTGKWPPYYADHVDNAPPTLDIGRGSPTAVAFGYGAKFPAEYQQALFILDWAYGRILAVHLASRGAGYRAQAETFVKGRPLNVTDVAIGPDGAMYVVTGGRKTQSALYRIAYVGTAPSGGDEPAAGHELAAAEYSRAAREVRKKLEAKHRPLEMAAIDVAWPYLAAADPVLRHAARVVLEHQPLDWWRERVLNEPQPEAALTGLMALVRSGDKAALAPVLRRLAKFDPRGLRLADKFALVQVYLLCWEQDKEAALAARESVLQQLDRLFPYRGEASHEICREGTGERFNRDLARLLAAYEAPAIVPRVMKSLLASPVQEDRLQALYVLRSVREGWTPELRRAYFAVLADDKSLLGGQGMPRTFELIRGDVLPTLSEEEKQQLAAMLTPQAITSEPLPPPRPRIQKWSVADFADELAANPLPGDPARGARVFEAALCARCHRAGLVGPAVGPDLTNVGNRFSPRDILESVLAPSSVVAENYRNVQITTTDGRQIVGRVAAEGDFRSEELRIAIEPLDPAASVVISKREIESYREVSTSPMPEGLLDGFTKAEVCDLLAFLTK